MFHTLIYIRSILYYYYYLRIYTILLMYFNVTYSQESWTCNFLGLRPGTSIPEHILESHLYTLMDIKVFMECLQRYNCTLINETLSLFRKMRMFQKLNGGLKLEEFLEVPLLCYCSIISRYISEAIL